MRPELGCQKFPYQRPNTQHPLLCLLTPTYFINENFYLFFRFSFLPLLTDVIARRSNLRMKQIETPNVKIG